MNNAIALVRAHDADTVSENMLQMSIVSKPTLFNLVMKGSVGYLTAGPNLNLNVIHEQHYVVNITVSDSQFTSVQNAIISITVVPKSNCELRFWNFTSTFNVNEELPVGTVLGNVKAIISNSKKLSNSTNISYNIVEPNMPFKIDNSSLVTLQKLDYEKNTLYHFHIMAIATENNVTFTAFMAALVTVNDINDHPPAFSGTLKVSVQENIRVGATIMTVSASDQDAGI